MKQLILVRHAKSDHSFDLEDFDRPLNKRGLRDAPIIAEYLKQNFPKPDIIISSPAKRTKTTTEIISKTLQIATEQIVFEEKLYLCYTSDYFEIINAQDNKYNTIMIVSHNPGTTEFSNILTGSKIDIVPTCGAINIQLQVENWSRVEPYSGKLVDFIYPKKINP